MSKKIVSAIITFDDGSTESMSFKVGCDCPLIFMERIIMPLLEACKMWKYSDILQIFDKDKSSYASEVGK